MGALCAGFMAHELAAGVDEGFVPCCGEPGAAGETGCGDAEEELGSTDTVGAIGDADGGDVEAGDSVGVPEISACINSNKPSVVVLLSQI